MTQPDTRWDADPDPERFRTSIEAACSAFCDAQRSLLEPLGDDAARLLDQARAAVSGGKRFRATFCWWGFQSVAPPSDDAAAAALVRACASLEFLHASALVHDDYMDASDVRRGRPATHRVFEALHRDRGWTGPSTGYGAAAAILLGDLLLSWADEMLRTCGLEAAAVLNALRYFDLTRTEVVAGQFLDVSVQARGQADVRTAMTVLRYKSAKYSIERPLHVGAALAGADPELIEQLSAFGLPLGEAFQLRDDVLGVFGDPALTGKPAGDDLREGKRTVLVARALEALPPGDAARLDDALGTLLTDAEVADLRDLIDRSGARQQVEAAITELTGQALAALAEARITGAARSALAALAARVTQREV